MCIPDESVPLRYVGLDIHKAYFVAIGVNRDKEPVFGPQRVPNGQLAAWIGRELTECDAVVLEMTTNTWTMVDALEPHVHSVTVTHPPHVHLITRAQVMTNNKAALILAQLHAAGLLPAVWIPPAAVRSLRALVAQRWKMVRLVTQAKCRLQSLLHRYHFDSPPKRDPYTPHMRPWWEALPVEPLEAFRLQSDLDTVAFAHAQKARIETCLAQFAARDDRVPLLAQLPGIGLVAAMTLLGAIGDIARFPTATQLVGYAGLGAQVHDSGQAHWSGRITKAGRRDIRRVMVDAASHAVQMRGHWREVYERLKPRLGRPKALVAVARKLLIAVWHVLTHGEADRFASDEQVACSFFALAYKLQVRNLPDGMSALQFTRHHLDRLGIGRELTHIRWGSKTYKLPLSGLAQSG